jgi:hypothetical protein
LGPPQGDVAAEAGRLLAMYTNPLDLHDLLAELDR